jgi:hypothetical protein
MELSESNLNVPNQQPVDRQAVYARVRAALQAGELEQAHRWLRAMLDEDGKDPELWLLLAWTAPSRRSAEVFFKRLQRLQPDHPRARGAAPWSGRAWKPASPGALPEAALPRLPGRGAAGAQAGGMALDSLRAGLRGRLAGYSFVAYLAVYMLAITLAETVTTFLSPHAGLVIHGTLLVAMLLHASFWASAAERNFLLALGLAPLIRLMSLSMPLLNFDYMYWYMVIGIPLLVSTVVVYRLGGYRAGQVGLGVGKNLPLQLGIALGGVGLGYLEYLILRPEPLAATLSLESIWLPALILLVFTGFLEELIFRGLMQRASAEPLRKLGPLYISLLFAVLHIGYQSWVDLLFVFGVGYLFSLVVERTRSIWGVTLAHGLTNITLFLVFPFLISAPVKPDVVIAPPALTQGAPGAVVPGATAAVVAAPEATRPARLPDIFMAPPTPTPRPTQTPAATPTQMPSATPTQPPTPTPCVVNPAWVRYVVQPGDTLVSLRQLYNLKKIELLDGGCLSRDLEELRVGQVIYVPFLPLTATPLPPTLPPPTPLPPTPRPTLPPTQAPLPTNPVVRPTLAPPTAPPSPTEPPPPTQAPTPTEPVMRPSPTPEPTEQAALPSPTP